MISAQTVASQTLGGGNQTLGQAGHRHQLGEEGVAQVGTCVVFRRLGTYPAAECTLCPWVYEAIYEDDLARRVAEHSRAPAMGRP